MKKLLFFALVLLFSGCVKEPVVEPKEPCEVFNTGVVKVVNTQGDPYNIYLNNVFKGVVNANATLDISVPVNTYSFLAEQKSGYLLYPTQYTGSASPLQCRSQAVTF